MNKPKILLWHWGRRGGGPRYTFELARALMAQGNADIHLSLSHQSEIFSEFGSLSAPSHHIDTYDNLSGAITATLRLPIIRRRLWRYIEEKNIDLIVGTMSHLWNVPMLAGRKNKPPYLMVLHDALPHPGDDVFLRHWLLKREIHYADGIVTLAEHVRGILCKQYQYPANRTWMVPHGVFPYASPSCDTPRPGPLKILFFGRILPYKGLDLLLTAYGMLRAEGLAVELLICGAGDLQPYASMIDTLEGVTVDNRWIAETEIGSIFRKADISVSPYKEASQSGVIATAYAAGIPVVVTPIGGLVEQVIHERTGLIASNVSAVAIADALRRMLSDRLLRETCAQGAAREAQGTLSWPVIAGRFSQAMEEMLKKSRRTGAD